MNPRPRGFFYPVKHAEVRVGEGLAVAGQQPCVVVQLVDEANKLIRRNGRRHLCEAAVGILDVRVCRKLLALAHIRPKVLANALAAVAVDVIRYGRTMSRGKLCGCHCKVVPVVRIEVVPPLLQVFNEVKCVHGGVSLACLSYYPVQKKGTKYNGNAGISSCYIGVSFCPTVSTEEVLVRVGRLINRPVMQMLQSTMTGMPSAEHVPFEPHVGTMWSRRLAGRRQRTRTGLLPQSGRQLQAQPPSCKEAYRFPRPYRTINESQYRMKTLSWVPLVITVFSARSRQ